MTWQATPHKHQTEAGKAPRDKMKEPDRTLLTSSVISASYPRDVTRSEVRVRTQRRTATSTTNHKLFRFSGRVKIQQFTWVYFISTVFLSVWVISSVRVLMFNYFSSHSTEQQHQRQWRHSSASTLHAKAGATAKVRWIIQNDKRQTPCWQF